MAASSRDLVVAPATPAAPARRAVLRLTGPDLHARADAFLPPGCPRPRGRREALGGQLEWTHGAWVEVDLLVFPGPGSATGEDVLELHLPGSPPVVRAVLDGLLGRGLRLAEPGEFTRRAFLHGRLDLAQVEAVLHLVEARSGAEARAAAGVLAGPTGGALQRARAALLAACVELEATLDFEEGDSQDVRADEIEPLLAEAAAVLAEGARGEAGRRLRSGPWRIGLRGAPNAGKSSLFARLSGAPVLVADEAGTTRDRLEADWAAPGQEEAWRLADHPGTGGVAVDARDARARARSAADEADLWWLLVDASDPAAALPEPPAGCPAVLVWTKADRPRGVPEPVVAAAPPALPQVWVSAREGTGLAALARETAALLAAEEDRRRAGVRVGERCREALGRAARAVERARAGRRGGLPADLVAEELRAALGALGELVGELTPEELLDHVFARFCLGK